MKVSRSGEVIIPPEIQEIAGIHPGDQVDLRYENGAITVRRREPDERTREFMRNLDEVRREYRERRRQNTGSMDALQKLSRGEQFVQLLAGAGQGRMTTDEIMELTRGPYDDLDPG